jgi:hypothetical protein
MNYYNNFNTKLVDGQSLIHAINFLKSTTLIGAEVGVGKGQNLCTFLQTCPRISQIYAIDSYRPHKDFLWDEGISFRDVDEKEIDYIRSIAMHNIKWSGNKDKVIFLECDSSEASHLIKDEELDFIFIDVCVEQHQVFEELIRWYPKVKKGGIFAGHDWTAPSVERAVGRLMNDINIQSSLSIFDNTWGFVK